MTVSTPSDLSSLSRELAAALEWWQEAGVENDFSDDVTAWLDPPKDTVCEQAPREAGDHGGVAVHVTQTPTKKASQPAPKRIDFFAEGKPETLEAFREFWLTTPGIDAIGPRGRVPPKGAKGAEVMVLVVDPEPNDTQELLSGPQGQLLTGILAAIGVSGEQSYIASALPRSTPMADTAALAQGGLDAVLQHHIALVEPKRLIAFGAGLAPLLGENVTNGDPSLRIIHHNSSSSPVLMSEGLDTLIDMPRLKARFWRRWLEWSAMH